MGLSRDGGGGGGVFRKRKKKAEGCRARESIREECKKREVNPGF